MGYELTTAQKARVLDGNGEPVPFAGLTIVGPVGNPAAASDVIDDGGVATFVGQVPGTNSYGLDGVVHDVTVTAAPFAWTLDTPVAK